MAKSRTITRTWTTKSGEVKTATYTYKNKQRQYTLIYKSGKINDSAPLNALREKYSQGDVSKAFRFDARIRQFIKDAQNKKVSKRLTWNSLQARLTNSSIERVIRNFGYDPEEFAIEIATRYNQVIDVDYILNDSHWDSDYTFLLLPDGQRVEFVYDYNSGVLFR